MATSFFSLLFQNIFECGSPSAIEKMDAYDRAIYLGALSSDDDDSSESSILDKNSSDPYTMFAMQQQRELLIHKMRVCNNNNNNNDGADGSIVRDHFGGLFRCDAMDLTYRNKEDNSILLPELEVGLLQRCDAMDLTYRHRRDGDNSTLIPELEGVDMEGYYLRERTRLEKHHSDNEDEPKNNNNTTSAKYVVQLETTHPNDDDTKKADTACTTTKNDDSYRYVIRLAPQNTKQHFPHKLHSYRGDHPELRLRRTQSESMSQLPEVQFR